MLGSKHSWECSPASARNAVFRNVAAGVKYQRPPLGEGALVWHKVPDADQDWEMPWDEPPSSVQTFGQLCGELRERVDEFRDLPPDAEEPGELAELDNASRRLLEVAEQLHAQRCGLGVLTPEGILHVPGTLGKEIVLPDLGFYYDAGQGFLVGPVYRKKVAQEYGFLSDSIEAQERRGLVAPEDETFDPTPDIRALGRLFVFGLLGWKESRMPTPEEAPDTISRGGGKDSVWDTLAAAVDGEIPTVTEFRQRLSAAPLSQHFRSRPRFDAGGSCRRRCPLRLVLLPLVAVVAVALALAFLVNRPPVDKPKPDGEGAQVAIDDVKPATVPGTSLPLDAALTGERPEQELPPSSALRALGDQFEGGSPDERVESVVAMHDESIWSDDPQARQLERQWAGYYRTCYLDQWAERVMGVLRGPAQAASQRHVACEKLTTLIGELTKVTESSDSDDLRRACEERRSRFVGFARQLGVPESHLPQSTSR